MGLEDIGDKVKQREEKNRADRLGLEEVEELESVDDMIKKYNLMRELVIKQDSRIESLEEEVESLKALLSLAIRDENEDENREEEENEEPDFGWQTGQ
jgi:hypothetical protein